MKPKKPSHHYQMVKPKPNSVTIDREYSGHETTIATFITQILTIWKIPVPHVLFKEIGKGSSAHLIGYQAYKKHQKDALILYNLIDKA